MHIWISGETVEEPMLHGFKKGKSIIFENASMNPYETRVNFKLDQEQFDSFYRQLFSLATEVWGEIELKEVTGLGNDYGEYYDRELDNDGSASIGSESISFRPPAPHLESNRLYRFTKRKIETYLYDLRKHTRYKDSQHTAETLS